MSRFNSTDTRSRDFATDEEKIRFVRRYFRLFSEVRAAEFHIKYDASEKADSFDMRGAFLVAPGDCGEWLIGDPVKADSSTIVRWFEDILPGDRRWHRTSQPIIHQRPDGHAVIVAYPTEGLILKRVCEPLLAWLGDPAKVCD